MIYDVNNTGGYVDGQLLFIKDIATSTVPKVNPGESSGS